MTRSPTVKPFIRKLTEKQKALNLNDAQFGMKLGISRTWWNQVRLGYAQLGKVTIAKVMGEFPDLMPDVLIYLRGDKSQDDGDGNDHDEG